MISYSVRQRKIDLTTQKKIGLKKTKNNIGFKTKNKIGIKQNIGLKTQKKIDLKIVSVFEKIIKFFNNPKNIVFVLVVIIGLVVLYFIMKKDKKLIDNSEEQENKESKKKESQVEESEVQELKKESKKKELKKEESAEEEFEQYKDTSFEELQYEEQVVKFFKQDYYEENNIFKRISYYDIHQSIKSEGTKFVGGLFSYTDNHIKKVCFQMYDYSEFNDDTSYLFLGYFRFEKLLKIIREKDLRCDTTKSLYFDIGDYSIFLEKVKPENVYEYDNPYGVTIKNGNDTEEKVFCKMKPVNRVNHKICFYTTNPEKWTNLLKKLKKKLNN